MTKWVSLHMHYFDNQDSLILNCIGPAVEELRASGVIDLSFFVRYWLNGMHVRVRAHTQDQGKYGYVSNYLNERFNSYVTAHPSTMPETRDLLPLQHHLHKLEYGVQGEIEMNPDNSVHDVEYVPEYERYGGCAGIKIAERHFDVSSRLAIRVLGRFPDSHRRLLAYIQFGIIALEVFGNDRKRKLKFFEAYGEYWQRFLPPTAARQRETQTPMSGRGFSSSVREFEDRIKKEPEKLDQELKDWYLHCLQLHSDLAGLRQLDGSSPGGINPNLRNPDANRLLGHYLHMLANRLGISPAQETVVAWAMVRELS